MLSSSLLVLLMCTWVWDRPLGHGQLTCGYIPPPQAILLPSTDSHQLPIGPNLRNGDSPIPAGGSHAGIGQVTAVAECGLISSCLKDSVLEISSPSSCAYFLPPLLQCSFSLWCGEMDIRGSAMAEQPESHILSALKVTDLCINMANCKKKLLWLRLRFISMGIKVISRRQFDNMTI